MIEKYIEDIAERKKGAAGCAGVYIGGRRNGADVVYAQPENIMIQRTLITDDPEELINYIRELKEERAYREAGERFLQICDQEDDPEALREKVDAIKSVLGDISIVGVTMAAVAVAPEYRGLKKGAVYTFFLFEHSRVEVFHYDCRKLTAGEAGKHFLWEIRNREHVAGIMMFTAGVMLEINQFLTVISGCDIPIIGVEAGAEHKPCLFGDFVDDRGIVALVFSGRNLHMYYNYDMGWKAIGKEMRVTKMEGNYCVSAIDDMPAISIYQRYLGVNPDQYFVENVREFPLITDRGERQVVRCPSGYDNDGKLYFIAKVNVGDVVRLSYANPRRLIEDTKRYADSMRDFEPQALFLVVCENRARFLGDLTASDIANYRQFAPQMAWARGFAAIMLDKHGGGVVNSAIVSVGLREGAPGGERREEYAVLPTELPTKGAIPLNERLARFLEQTTKELEDMAIAADAANSAKSVFLSNMSHEIRTPINAILGLNEMILRESSEEPILAYARNVHTAGLSLLGIISDILDFSRIEAGKMDIVTADYELSSLINDLVNLIRARAVEKGLALEIKVNEQIPHLLHGDEIKVKQVITNLLTNAVKYTEQGTVSLIVDYCVQSEEEIALTVAVRDTGIGIRKENMNKLFTAFDRIDKERARRIEGTGLGLNITQEILALMGSRLEVTSEYGVGSEFSFALVQKVADWSEFGDYREAMQNADKRREQSSVRFVAPKARVLVVDDAPMNLIVISGLLKRTRIQIDTAVSGKECLEMFGSTDYDLVFLDHRMPEMDGVETLEQMKSRYADKAKLTPIICLTANAMSGAREQYITAGFNDYLTKPVMVEELEQMLVRYLPEEKILRETSGDEEAEEEPLPEWLEGIRQLHTDKGIAYCGGTQSYIEALMIFAESIPMKAEEIQTYFEEKDWINYTIKVHALKSMARSIGALELSELARSLEDAGDVGDLVAIEENTGTLLEMYRGLLTPLEPLFLREGSKIESLPELSPEQFKDALLSIRELASCFDHESVKMVMDSLETYRIPDEYKQLYHRIDDAVKRLHWDDINETIDLFMMNELHK